MSISAEVASIVDEVRLIRFAQWVLRIPSPRFEEWRLANYLSAYLHGIGFEVNLPSLERRGRATKQVVATRRGTRTGPTLILNAHLDTGSGQYEGLVFAPERWSRDPLSGDVEDGWIYGLGVRNNKNGIIACTMAADAIVRSGAPFRGTLVLAFSALETAGGIGTEQLLKDGLKGDAAIVTEGTGQDIVTISVGNFRGTITVYGGYAHHDPYDSAIDRAYAVLRAFGPPYSSLPQDGWLRFEPYPMLKGYPRAAIRRITSELDSCTLYFDIVAVPSMTPQSVETDLSRLLDRLSAENRGFRAKLHVDRWIAPYIENNIYGAAEEPRDSQVVQAVARAHVQIMGSPPVIGLGKREGAAADSSIFRRYGIPTIEYGPGSVEDVGIWPSGDERVKVADLVNCSRVLAAAVLELGAV